VLFDTERVPRWHVDVIEAIMASQCAELCLVIRCCTAAENRTDDRSFSWFHRIMAWDESRASVPLNACEYFNKIEACRGVPSLTLPNAISSAGERLPEDIAGHLAAYQIDVIVSLNSYTLSRALSAVCRLGVLYYSHGSGQTQITDGSTAGFWEVIRRDPTIYSALLMWPAGGTDAHIVFETRSGISHTSITTSRNEHLCKITALVPRVLSSFGHKSAKESRQDLPEFAESDRNTAPSRATRPTNARLILPLLRYLGWRTRKKIWNRRFAERWVLMLGIAEKNLDFSQFRKLLPPKGRFWADPHLYSRNGEHYVFFEDADLSTWKGRIAVTKLSTSGACGEPVTILERDYHLSYPFILEWQNELYMIPESAENRTVEVYRCLDFPYDWEFSHNLMEDVAAYDATLLEHDGRWWMFVNIRGRPCASSWDELYLFHAGSPLATDWIPHPHNPVISDVCNARPAGQFLTAGGKLYRPSQNSAYQYGYGLNINEITELSPNNYKEVLTHAYRPDWDRTISGLHSFSRLGTLVLIDVMNRQAKSDVLSE